MKMGCPIFIDPYGVVLDLSEPIGQEVGARVLRLDHGGELFFMGPHGRELSDLSAPLLRYSACGGSLPERGVAALWAYLQTQPPLRSYVILTAFPEDYLPLLSRVVPVFEGRGFRSEHVPLLKESLRFGYADERTLLRTHLDKAMAYLEWLHKSKLAPEVRGQCIQRVTENLREVTLRGVALEDLHLQRKP